ncbi:uncharacterized protein LOC116405881 [Cucumis sativus]|uniref:uncharacterized protein LOC116405881 n=1 Tax=Cucumis sativus TaxID=3659 RepID=UPI0012F4C31A|nr:uncharacterized protein LOC116405881 [Cucumis sativus]
MGEVRPDALPPRSKIAPLPVQICGAVALPSLQPSAAISVREARPPREPVTAGCLLLSFLLCFQPSRRRFLLLRRLHCRATLRPFVYGLSVARHLFAKPLLDFFREDLGSFFIDFNVVKELNKFEGKGIMPPREEVRRGGRRGRGRGVVGPR